MARGKGGSQCLGCVYGTLTSVKIGELKLPANTPLSRAVLDGSIPNTGSPHPPNPPERAAPGGTGVSWRTTHRAMIAGASYKGLSGILRVLLHRGGNVELGPLLETLHWATAGSSANLFLYKKGGRSGCSPAQFKHISQRRKRNQ